MTALLRLLAVPRTREDRRRWAAVALVTALAGGLLLLAAAIARLPWGSPGGGEQWTGPREVSEFVEQPGLRPGAVLAAVLLALPAAGLGVQALALGSALREQRGRALRLAGAEPRQVRWLAAADGAGAAGLGALLAAPAHLLLHVVLGYGPRPALRFAPPLTPGDAVAWAAFVLLALAGGAWAGSRVAPEVRAHAGPRPTRWGLVVLVLGALAVGGGAWLVGTGRWNRSPYAEVGPVVVGLVLLGVAAVVAVTAPLALHRWAGRPRSHPLAVLAAHRVRARPVALGRVCAVLVLAGVVFGGAVAFAASYVATVPAGDLGPGSLAPFYVGGAGLVAVLAALGAATAVVTLWAGIADELTASRRELAALRALGVDPRDLEAVLARQVATGAVPAVALGAALPVVPGALRALAGAPAGAPAGAVAGVLAALLAAAAVRLACSALARSLRGRVRDACATENLRTP